LEILLLAKENLEMKIRQLEEEAYGIPTIMPIPGSAASQDLPILPVQKMFF